MNPDFRRSRRLPILTGRFQPTIFGTSELNCCVRNGNRWNLTVIDTGQNTKRAFALSRILLESDIPSKLNNHCVQIEYQDDVVKPSIY